MERKDYCPAVSQISIFIFRPSILHNLAPNSTPKVGSCCILKRGSRKRSRRQLLPTFALQIDTWFARQDKFGEKVVISLHRSAIILIIITNLAAPHPWICRSFLKLIFLGVPIRLKNRDCPLKKYKKVKLPYLSGWAGFACFKMARIAIACHPS